MLEILRVPHALIRRHLSFLERVLVSLGLTGLLYGLMNALPVYPLYWDAALLIAVFALGLWSTPAAYFFAVAVAIYPLYSLSLYLLVVFLVIALLGQHIFINNLGATLLVLATPWLAYYRLAWVIPLLGALWWGASGGAWMGGLAALWGKLVFGMAGINPDWLTSMGQAPSAMNMLVRYEQANSLDTLYLLVEPISADTTVLLYHLLQILAWVFVGGTLGLAVERAWLSHHHPWPNVALGVLGAIALPLLHIGLSFWLKQYTSLTLEPLWGELAMAAGLAAVVAGGLEILRDFFDHPLHTQISRERPVEAVSGRSARVAPGRVTAPNSKSKLKADQDEEVSPENEKLDDNIGVLPADSTQPPKPGSKNDNPDDLIMLELD